MVTSGVGSCEGLESVIVGDSASSPGQQKSETQPLSRSPDASAAPTSQRQCWGSDGEVSPGETFDGEPSVTHSGFCNWRPF